MVALRLPAGKKGKNGAAPAAAAPKLVSRRRLEVTLVILFTLVITLPFIFRPFHMDDTGFLKLAEERQTDPMTLVLHDYTFFGQQNEEFVDTHPPLVSSFQALIMRVTGDESETALHLGFILFPLIAAVSMYYLSRRFTSHALLATLLLMGTPGVMVMSHGLMSDVPGMSMWLATAALYLYGLERKSLSLMVFCAIALTAGVFISYQVLSMIPLLLVYAVVRRELSLLAVLPFVLPLSAFASYFGWHHSATGAFPRFSYGVGEPLAWYSVIQKGVSAALSLGGATVFFGVLFRVLVVNKWDFAVYLALLAPLWVAAMAQYLAGQQELGVALLFILFLPLGIMLVYRVYDDGWKRLKAERRDHVAQALFLLLWLSGVLFYVVVLLPYSSVRYLLPLYPPLIISFVRLVEDRFGSSPTLVKNILLAGVFGTTALGVLVAAADYELADVNRLFAQNEGARYGAQAAEEGHDLWFVGEFGFRYYMEQQGFRELPKDVVVPEGDLIIQSPLADPRPFSEDMMDKVELIDTVAYQSILPVRVTNFDAKAGFYGHFWGLLPFSVSTGSAEEFLVYKVVPPHPTGGILQEILTAPH